MKILLLGGTGAMGGDLTTILANQGQDVYVTTRRARQELSSVHYFVGNAHNDEFLQQIFSKNSFDVIVDFMVYASEEFKGKCNFLLSSCKQYIFTSSSRVYAESITTINEDSARLLDVSNDKEYLMTDEYALSKAREENILIQSKRKNWTIIRPYITFNRERLQLGVLEKEYWLYQALHDRTIIFSEDIASKSTTLTYGYDVARCIASIIGKSTTFGQIINLATSESHKWSEVFDLYIRVLEDELDRKVKYKIVKNSPNLNFPSEKWQVLYDRLYDRKFDTTKLNEYFDVSTFKPTLEGLELCLRSFIKDPVFGNLNWRQMALYDSIAGEWLPLSALPTLKSKIGYLFKRYSIYQIKCTKK